MKARSLINMIRSLVIDCLLLGAALLNCIPASAATLHVWQNSPSPSPPYDTWQNAATNIQDAVDAAQAGDTVLVTNGVYAAGGRAVVGTMTNRVVIDKAITVQSVNGPEVTLIIGAPSLGGTNGDGAIRCIYLSANAVLNGVTLTNGATRNTGDYRLEQTGGGLWCETTNVFVTNCVLTGNSAVGGGGAFGGTLHGCTLTRNAAESGGGARNSTLNRCTLEGNSASAGGGVFQGILDHCTLTNNSATHGSGGGASGARLYDCMLSGNSSTGTGGGASDSTFYRCTLTSNSASSGGGAGNSILHDCVLTGNSAAGGAGSIGGGAYLSTLYQCILTGNSSQWYGGGAGGNDQDDGYSALYNCILTRNSAQFGGGAGDCRLYNCTVIGNSATLYNGGTDECRVYNCIVYYNAAPTYPDSDGYDFNYSCTLPLPRGVGNISNEPAFMDLAAGNLRLQSNSPCINAGHNAYVPGDTDLDGLPRIVGDTVDMGAYEFQSPASLISYAWLQQYGLPTDGSADFTDSDNDRLNTWQEWRCRTDPTNALSVLRLLSAIPTEHDVNVSWQSEAGVNYFLERSTNLASSPAFLPLATNLMGRVGTTTFTDTNHSETMPAFYRVGVGD